MPKKQLKLEPTTNGNTAKKFDVPIVAEIEVVYRSIEAESDDDAMNKARRKWEEKDLPEEGPATTYIEVGPAIELVSHKPYKPPKTKKR